MGGRLEGKVALVVGGGSRFGQAVALALAREGATVAVGCGDDASGCATTALIAAEGKQATHVLMDPTDEASCTGAFEQALATHDRIDVLVTRVVSAPREPKTLEQLDETDWADAARHVVRAAALPVGRALAAMKARGSGSIVVIGSSAGLSAVAGMPTLSTAGAALIGLTRAAAAEASEGVRVNCLAVAPRTPAERVTPLIGFLASDEARELNGQVLTVGS
jgi:NAD(P)-dependent dehydrogenase (short-subunit alcohol dehydrogenase family)